MSEFRCGCISTFIFLHVTGCLSISYTYIISNFPLLYKRRFQDDPAFSPLHVVPSTPPPSASDQATLRRILVSGFLDCIARVAPPNTVQTGSRLQRNCAYISCNPAIHEPLYIHPHSCLFSADPAKLPEYVIYQQIVRNKKEMPYMVCVTEVKPEWISMMAAGTPLLKVSAPLTSPPPAYDAKEDCVVCYTIPKFGAHSWELKVQGLPMKDVCTDDMLYRWFARLFLEGGMCAEMKKLQEEEGLLNDSPAMITFKKPMKKVSMLLDLLVTHEISTFGELVEKWKEDKGFLRSAVLLWIRVEHQGKFKDMWTAMVKKYTTKK